MPLFYYKAMDRSWKTLQGNIEGNTERDVEDALRKMECYPLMITRLSDGTKQMLQGDILHGVMRRLKINGLFLTVLVLSTIAGLLFYHVLVTSWREREWKKELAEHGVQVQAVIVSMRGTNTHSRRHIAKYDYDYEFTDPGRERATDMKYSGSGEPAETQSGFPADRRYHGVISSHRHWVRDGIYCWRYPRSYRGKTEVGKLFTATWRGPEEPSFVVPLVVDDAEVARSTWLLIRKAGMAVFMQVILWGVYLSFFAPIPARWVFRPITVPRKQPGTLILRSHRPGYRMISVLAFLLALGIFYFSLTLDIHPLGAQFIVFTCILLGCYTWSIPRFALLDGHSGRITLKYDIAEQGALFTAPRSVHDRTDFHEVLTGLQWKSKSSRHGRVYSYHGYVNLSGPCSQTRIFEYGGPPPLARRFAWEAAEITSRLLDLPIREEIICE